MPKKTASRALRQESIRKKIEERSRQLLRRKEARLRRLPQGAQKYFQLQNVIRANLERIRPRSLKPLSEKETGRDYVFAGRSIDFKFGFGNLGPDTIQIRIKNGELLNESDWTMVCNEKKQIMIFSTNKIREYVIKNKGKLNKYFISDKAKYTAHKLPLKDLLGDFEYTGSIQTQTVLLKALKKMNRLENPNIPQKNPFLGVYPTRTQRRNIANALALRPSFPQYNRKIGQQRNR